MRVCGKVGRDWGYFWAGCWEGGREGERLGEIGGVEVYAGEDS